MTGIEPPLGGSFIYKATPFRGVAFRCIYRAAICGPYESNRYINILSTFGTFVNTSVSPFEPLRALVPDTFKELCTALWTCNRSRIRSHKGSFLHCELGFKLIQTIRTPLSDWFPACRDVPFLLALWADVDWLGERLWGFQFYFHSFASSCGSGL